MDELREDHIHAVTVEREGKYILRSTKSIRVRVIRLVVEGTVFKLSRPRLRAHEGAVRNIVAYWIDDYVRWFKKQRCDYREGVQRMLRELADSFSVIDEANVDSACAWLVQLVYDVGRDYEEGDVNVTDCDVLRLELQSLIETAIENL